MLGREEMKKFMGPIILVVSFAFASIALYYCYGVWTGISKHTPMCAPICADTVIIVFIFTGFGLFISIIGLGLVLKKRWLLCVAIVAVGLNLSALLIWSYWNITETLLPYGKFCDKVGMG